MYLAVDIGATKTLIAVFSEYGHCIRRIKFLTNHNKNLFLSELLANLSSLNHHFSSVVVAVPGPVQKNYSFTPPNLPWNNFDIKTPLKNLFSCPIYVLNDANLATLYESSSCKGLSIYLTFSTGIGGGIAKNGSVTSESSKFEPGHWKYSWEPTEKEWEDLAAASVFKKLYNKNVSSIRKSSSFDTIAYRVSLGLTDIIKKYSPKTIIIGGPLALIFPKFHPYLENYLKSEKKSRFPHIIPAKRPTESVIYGCYLYGKYHK